LVVNFGLDEKPGIERGNWWSIELWRFENNRQWTVDTVTTNEFGDFAMNCWKPFQEIRIHHLMPANNGNMNQSRSQCETFRCKVKSRLHLPNPINETLGSCNRIIREEVRETHNCNLLHPKLWAILSEFHERRWSKLTIWPCSSKTLGNVVWISREEVVEIHDLNLCYTKIWGVFTELSERRW
jgi:hypothetical protein